MHEQTKRVDSNVILYNINWAVDEDNIRKVDDSEVVLGSLDDDI